MRAVNEDAQTGFARTTVDIGRAAPLNVNLTASPPRTTAGDIVVFTATVSGSTVPIARYEWDFGDGASVTTTGNVVDHVYTTAGARTAGVTVFSVEGRGASQTTVIVAPPQMAVTLAIDPIVADAGRPVAFTATVAPATTVIVRYEWSFGDAGDSTARTTSPSTTFVYGADDRGSIPDRYGHRRCVRRDIGLDAGTGLDQRVAVLGRRCPTGLHRAADVPEFDVADKRR